MYTFERQQIIKTSLDKIWDFASNPANLQKITPANMGFEILNKNLSSKMYAGMIIAYKVSPISRLKMKWVTEITQVKEKEYFIDVQQEGPYRFWHHEHHFKETKDGILMTDILNYKPPFGIIGKIANTIFINRKLNQIFDYRKNKMEEIFN